MYSPAAASPPHSNLQESAIPITPNTTFVGKLPAPGSRKRFWSHDIAVAMIAPL